jgi:hypothetical protein
MHLKRTRIEGDLMQVKCARAAAGMLPGWRSAFAPRP